MRARRPVLALLAAGALTGLALGVAFGRGGAENASAEGPVGVLWRGEFRTVSWGTTGSATVERTSSGRLVLRLSSDFRTQRAPELFIHMGSTRMPLERPSGAQAYTLSGHVDPRAPVQVFCEKCNKAWGEARLHAVPHRIDRAATYRDRSTSSPKLVVTVPVAEPARMPTFPLSIPERSV